MAATTAEKIELLQELARSGESKLAAAFVLEVQWSDAVTRYYATMDYGSITPFAGIPLGPIYPIILNADPFGQFEVQPDLRTDSIPFTFDDLSRDINGLRISDHFKRYGTSRCKIWSYWPDANLAKEEWHGQLQLPPIYGHKIVSTQATNGYWSREKLIPHSMRPPDRCRTEHFGGELNSIFQVETNLCPYDRHLGGTQGLLNGSDPFISCPKDEAACMARFGHTRYFGGYPTDASATVSDGNTGYLAISKGNTSSNTRPIPVIAGTKHVRGFNMLMSRREPNQSDPDRGWFAGVWEIGDGQCLSIRNLKINDKTIEQQHLSIRGGERGQAAVANYNAGGTISNFSGVCHFSGRYGWTNPLNLTPSSMVAEGDIDGYIGVAVFNPTDAGNGLIAYYYTGQYFATLAGQQVVPNIDWPSTLNAPLPGMQNTDFGIRFLGSITFPFSETYTLTIDHDDDAIIDIGGSTVVDGSAGPGLHSGTFTATAGVAYSFKVDFRNANLPAPNWWRVSVAWSSPSTPAAVIPASAFTHGGASGYVRVWSNDRIWWTLEQYTNMRFGFGYDIDQVNTGDFYTAALWGYKNVTTSITGPDGETRAFTGRRTQFDAVLEGRPGVDQIVDTVRSGALSVPFQKDGQLTIRPFRAATADELANAPVFSDRITNRTSSTKRRIVHDDGMPAIQVNIVPDEQLPNEITLSFEAADNQDAARPITVDDPNQKRRAGKQLSSNGLLLTVPKRFAAFGIRQLQEAVRLAYRLLWFGDEGADAEANDTHGAKNNCKVLFYTPYEFAMDLERYQIIKMDSALLEGHGYSDPFGADEIPPSVPEGYGAEADGPTEITLTLGESDDIDAAVVVQFEYFRVLRLRRAPNGRMQIVAQAYNADAYDQFETESPVVVVPGGGGGGSGGGGGGDIHPDGGPCLLRFDAAHYNAESQSFEVSIQPC